MHCFCAQSQEHGCGNCFLLIRIFFLFVHVRKEEGGGLLFIITWEYTSMSFCVKVFRVDGTMEAQSCRERMNTTCCTNEHACDTRSPREGGGDRGGAAKKKLPLNYP